MQKLKLGLVGCGAIGEGIALFLDKELREKAYLWAICDKDLEKAELLTQRLSFSPRILPLKELIPAVDLVIEAASVEAAKLILKEAIKFRKDVFILSVGALIENSFFIQELEKRQINLYVPSGAICGIDGIGALSLAKIKRISLITTKPPASLPAGYLEKKGISLAHLKKERLVFKGSVKEAIRYFPQNINVAATLLLASSDFGKKFTLSKKKIAVYIKVDPKIKRNLHRIEIYTDQAKIIMSVENLPSQMNPKTSALAILSSQYLLKKIFSSFKIGS